jgi:hypothetical protein
MNKRRRHQICTYEYCTTKVLFAVPSKNNFYMITCCAAKTLLYLDCVVRLSDREDLFQEDDDVSTAPPYLETVVHVLGCTAINYGLWSE